VLPKPPRELLELELELRPTEGTDVRLVDGENRLRLAEACVVDGVVDRLDQYEERLPDEDERELELQGVAAGLAAPAAPGARVCGLTAPTAAVWPDAAQSRCGMNA
jgi:hypothetical protein